MTKKYPALRMFRKSGNRFSEQNMRKIENLERITFDQSGCALATK